MNALVRISNKLIFDWATKHLQAVKNKYLSWGVKASGEYGNALKITQKGNDTIITGAKYSEYTEHGRRAGKFPNVGAIRQWIVDKHITPDNPKISVNQLAYLIGRKIAKKGVKGSAQRYNKSSNLFESEFNTQTIKELNDELFDVTKMQVTDELRKLFLYEFKKI
jgi:hypothetical protein